MDTIGRLVAAMTDYYAGDPRRIGHFLKVYGFAKAIGEQENLDARTQLILEIAALTHDIGIKNSEIKYKSAAGHHQQTEGPPEAEKLLSALEIEADTVRRVSYLIAHHHTSTEESSPDYRILIEADFLVNAYEDALPTAAIRSAGEKIFRTETGRSFLHRIYLQSEPEGGSI